MLTTDRESVKHIIDREVTNEALPISLCLDGQAENLTNRQLGGMDMQPRAT